MSLDVYLVREIEEVSFTCEGCGHQHMKKREDILYEDNITHNLNEMAEEAGMYELLWRPEDLGAFEARQLIHPLRAGLALLREEPARFKKFNPENGWGNYEILVKFVENYLAACEEYPAARVSVSR